jgi:hypothetical protein
MGNDRARLRSSVKLFFQSSSRIRHKSDSIQLTVGLQRDRKENGAESFHCDRIVPPNPATRTMRRKSRAKKSAAKNSARRNLRTKIRGKKIRRRNDARKFSDERIYRHENGRVSQEDAAGTSTTTRRNEIRAL